ncbi:MAG: TlpA disulfide reductase family protein [Gemmataceae bacterium]
MRPILLAPLVLFAGALFFVSASAPAQEKAGEVRLDVVKYAGLTDAILKCRGKVVYVDFWFFNCPPCKTGMPHLVEMYSKFHKDGFEVITVNINAEDLPAEENLKKSLGVLQENKAAFRNVVLEDGFAVCEKLKIAEFPAAFVFDRKGQWTRLAQPIDLVAAERLVEKLLREGK